MISSWAVETSRSTADWASSGSAIMDSHSSAVRLEVTMVEVLLVAFDAELVEVGGLGGVQGLEREIVQDQQLDAGESADLGFQGVIEPGGLEPLEQLGGGGHEHGAAAADGDVAERAGQMGLADSDRAQDAGRRAGRRGTAG